MLESIGKRIARLRQEHGWTQQDLSTRLAISRVALSHIEMDLIVPSERTVTLLAGLFKLEPLDLVEGTTYPASKAERLPSGICCYSQLEVELALLQNDLKWLEEIKALKVNGFDLSRLERAVRQKWQPRLAYWEKECMDSQDKERLAKARQTLREISQFSKIS